MTTWIDRRRIDTTTRHHLVVETLRRHPLAMDPAEARRQCAISMLTPALAPVVPIERPTRLSLAEAANLYLLTPQAPCGLAKIIAADNGHDYAALLTEIVRQRHRTRFA